MLFRSNVSAVDVGIDVGSTTTKICALDARSHNLLHTSYERHGARQAGSVRAALQTLQRLFPQATLRVALTGSGAAPIADALGMPFVQEVVAKGGRGSGKSSYVSLELVYRLLRTPDCHAVVLRKVAGTLRNSVYNQILWAIQTLGCAAYFRCTVSPMECTYLPTGQKILFFGLDDAGKLKSLKLPFGAVGLCWFEELDQFDGPEEVRNVEQSIFRGGSYSLTLKSFNPPAMARSWVNRYAQIGRAHV